MITVIEVENVGRPDASEAKRVVLLSTGTPASLTMTGADVPGLNDDDIIAAGSVLITPCANYIAFEDGVFTQKG
jgi:hypothetical protein